MSKITSLRDKKLKIYEVPAVKRTIAILNLLGERNAATLSEIHIGLSLPKTSVYQILLTLEREGFVRRTADSSRFSLGLKLFEIGNQAVAHFDIRAEAIPILHKLMLETNQTCHLGVLDGKDGVYLAKVESTQPIKINSWAGKRLPLHATSMGKVLLCQKSRSEIIDILGVGPLPAITPNTLVDLEKLIEQLNVVRKKGWSFDDEEAEPHTRCIGVPVFDASEKIVAAMSVSGLSATMPDNILPTIGKLAMSAALELSQKLGYKGQFEKKAIRNQQKRRMESDR
jgi:DNA-binding IclR family transcriptional regulator